MGRSFGDLKPGHPVLEWHNGIGRIRKVVGYLDCELVLDNGKTYHCLPDEIMIVMTKNAQLAKHPDEDWILFAGIREGQRWLQDRFLEEKRRGHESMIKLRDAIRTHLSKNS